MQATAQLLAHARSALDQSALLLAEMQQNPSSRRLATGPRHPGAASRSIIEPARRYRLLIEAFHEMQGQTQAGLPGAWRRFLLRYDEYLEAVLDVQCALSREECGETPSTTAMVLSDSPGHVSGIPAKADRGIRPAT